MTLSKGMTLESSPQGSRAVRIDRFGRPEVFSPQRPPVILRVRAASVSPVDYKIRSGKYPAVTESPSSRADETIGEPESGHQQHHGRICASSGRKD
jgi:NADPH:quinone reductase-like Zn-dependent oxidoreductase